MAMTAHVRRLRSEGHDIVLLLSGEPDFAAPGPAAEAGIAAIREGDTKYTVAEGSIELRRALSAKFKRDNDLDYAPDQIVVSSGSKPLLHAALLLMADPGDEVIVPAPYWATYPDMVRIAGAVPVIVPGSPGNGFRLRPEALAAAITPRTRALILNSPNNPTGTIYSADDLHALADVLRAHPAIWALTDEIYEHLRFEGGAMPSLAAIPGFADRVVTTGGFSKGYAMTGWRMGFAGGPKPMMQAIGGVVSQLVGAPNTISQAAALAALSSGPAFLADNAALFRQRRDIALQALRQMPGIRCHQPEGAFYLFADISGAIGKRLPGGARIETDEDFCRGALDHAGVALHPGSSFGLSPYFRLSYAVATADLRRGLDRLRRYCNELA
jgi:aspartate aminotransferase